MGYTTGQKRSFFLHRTSSASLFEIPEPVPFVSGGRRVAADKNHVSSTTGNPHARPGAWVLPKAPLEWKVVPTFTKSQETERN